MTEENQNSTTTEKDFKEEKIRSFRTFETDIADYAKGKNLSLLDIAIEEAKFRGAGFEYEEERKPAIKKIIFVFAATLVFAAILAGAYFSLSGKIFKNKNIGEQTGKLAYLAAQPPIITDGNAEIIATENRKELFLRDIAGVMEGGSGNGGLFNISIVKYAADDKKNIAAGEFFKIAKITIPEDLLENLGNSFALLKFDSDLVYPILIFKTDSYKYAFAAMMKWEKTMPWDLRNIFTIGDSVGIYGEFSDKFIKNRDARVFSGNKEIKLIYSFIDRDYLIITNGEKPLEEIIERFSSPQYVNPRAGW